MADLITGYFQNGGQESSNHEQMKVLDPVNGGLYSIWRSGISLK